MPTTHKDAAVSFLDLSSSGNVEKAYGDYVAENFRHHNPHFEAGAEALAQAQKENADKFPNKKFEVQRVLEDDDLVAVHSRVQLNPEQPKIAVVHLFRFEGNRIAELWDVAANVPEDSPNENGAF